MVRAPSPTIIGLLEKEVNVYAVGLVVINNMHAGDEMTATIVIVLFVFISVLPPPHTDNTSAQISTFTPTLSVPNTFALVHKDDVVEEPETDGLFPRKKAMDYGEPEDGTVINPVARSWI